MNGFVKTTVLLALLTSFGSAKPICVKKRNVLSCRFENVRIEIFANTSELPVRLRDGNLLDIAINDKILPCFINPSRQKAECLTGKTGIQKRHLYISTDGRELNRKRLEKLLTRFYAIQASKQTKDAAYPTQSFPWQHIPDTQQLRGDIDGDGLNEIVVWERDTRQEIGDFYRLRIYRKDGSLLWQSPETIDSDDPYAFGSWDFGESLPEILVDIDNDGQTELLAPAAASDVSPVYYRIFGWNGRIMTPRRPAVLMCDRKDRNRFVWVNPYPGDTTQGCWVSALHSIGSDRMATAELTYATRQATKTATARIRFTPYGAELIRWIEPPSAVSDTADTANVHRYIARIGRQDHYNSKGVRLNDYRAVLHQERANYYRGKGDKEDTGAGIFDTPEKRNRIDRMPIEATNLSLRALKRTIIENHPLLRVTVFPDRMQIEKIGD